MATNESEFAVHLTTPKGKPFVLLPGDEIPEWALKSITNPYVLGIDPDAASDDDADDIDSDGPPSKRAGVKAWAAYAGKNEVDVEGLDKAEIVAKLEDAGIPVE